VARPQWRQLAKSLNPGTTPVRFRTEVQRCTGIHRRLGSTERDPLDTWWNA
jgi:hypothetical protein